MLGTKSPLFSNTQHHLLELALYFLFMIILMTTAWVISIVTTVIMFLFFITVRDFSGGMSILSQIDFTSERVYLFTQVSIMILLFVSLKHFLRTTTRAGLN